MTKQTPFNYSISFQVNLESKFQILLLVSEIEVHRISGRNIPEQIPLILWSDLESRTNTGLTATHV